MFKVEYLKNFKNLGLQKLVFMTKLL